MHRKIFILIVLLRTGFAASTQVAKFTYQFHSNEAKGGSFEFTSPNDTLSFKATASAGYLVRSNNPYFQATRNVGPIPNGTWTIYAIKSEEKAILRIRPESDVTIQNRDGFLIHGTGADRTPEQSSLGCIILDKQFRKKLLAAFKEYGEFKVIVSNQVTSDPTHRG